MSKAAIEYAHEFTPSHPFEAISRNQIGVPVVSVEAVYAGGLVLASVCDAAMYGNMFKYPFTHCAKPWVRCFEN